MPLIFEAERTCPDRNKHTSCPEDYMLWHEWAEEKGKTHRQIRCKGCNLFTIWVPKLRVVAPSPSLNSTRGTMPVNKGNGAAIKWIRDRSCYLDPKCLIWPFYRMPTGYGNFSYLGESHYAHRYMCELVHGLPPTPKHEAAHKCGNGHQGCVNPRHLAWKTKKENRRESTQHGKGTRSHYGRKGALKPADVARIWNMKGTMRQVDIAAQFGVSWQVISGIYCGRHYKQFAPVQSS